VVRTVAQIMTPNPVVIEPENSVATAIRLMRKGGLRRLPVVEKGRLVGVVTSGDFTRVLAIGYNGNAKGLPNRCDSTAPGNCGCIHSEVNALVKAPGGLRDKVVFLTDSPCVMCAKLMINSGVTHVFYRRLYRDPSGVELLQSAGVTPVLYDRWADAWR